MIEKGIIEWLAESVEKPDSFWAEEGDKYTWWKKWSALRREEPDVSPRWFDGGVTNLCANALDRHANGKNRGKAALIWENAETGETKVYTYWHLFGEVNRFAGALKNMGVMPGTRVLVYLPMIPEAAISLLACARVGAVSSTIWPGAGILPLTNRLKEFKPRVVVTADGFLYRGRKAQMKAMLDSSIEESGLTVNQVVVLDRKLSPWEQVGLREVTWKEAMEQLGEHAVTPEKLASSAPSGMVYTSGATGRPRPLLRDTGGTMVALGAAMRASGVGEDDIVLSTSDIGAPHGPDDAIFGPLLIGATSVLYEGLPDYPTPGSWWDALEKHGATTVICPTADFAWLRRFHSKWIASHNLAGLRRIVVHGEPLHEAARKWAGEMFRAPLIEQYRLAEFTLPLLTTTQGDESRFHAGPGVHLEALDAEGKSSAPHAVGRLFVKAPFPPGFNNSPDESENKQGADSGGYDTGDVAQCSEGGEFKVLGRAGDEIRVGGEIYPSRLIEEIIVSNFVVAEAAVAQGEEVAAFVALKDKMPGANPLKDEIIKAVRDALGEEAALKKVMFIKALPRTPSGKALRRVLKAMLLETGVGDLSSIRNPDILPIVKDAIKASRL